MAKGRRHTPEQIVSLLQRIDMETASGKKTSKACYEAGISEPTYYRWYKEYGGLDADQAARMNALLRENEDLKRMLDKAQRARKERPDTCRS